MNEAINDRLKILFILSDHKWHCGSEILSKVQTKDDRTRISELRKRGVKLDSKPCDGFCGTLHKRGLYKRLLIYAPPELLEQARTNETPNTIQRAVQPETPRRIENTASQTTQTSNGSYAYYKPEPTACCPIWKASKFAHSIKCSNQT